MRSDAIGLFWEDIPKVRGQAARVMPPIPDTGWVAPTEFPNLAAAKILTVDVETWDPELETRGPGWARGSGHIVGIGVGAEDAHWYFPMRHEVSPEQNLDPEHVLAWARDTLCDPNQPKVGANITYDIGWLREEGIHVRGQLYDVQFAEALLAESRTVALDHLGERYLGVGKTGQVLYDWCAAYYGKAATDVQRQNIYRAPPNLVGPYAEGDVTLPFYVLNKQWPLLHAEGLFDLFVMECKLIYLMVEMRFAGVSVDLDRAEQMKEKLTADLVIIDSEIKDLVGFEVNTNAYTSMAEAFDEVGLWYGYTDKGNPTFPASFLKTVDHPLSDLIQKKKAREKLRGTFVQGYILDSHVDGKVYGQFHQLRSDRGGARSGRFASSNPNLQNIPSRSKLGKAIRKAFVPDPGHEQWRKNDYSQIEYRGLAHYAVGPKADEVRRLYNTNPDTDFHVMVQNIVFELTGLLGEAEDRPIVKNVNFGTVYGMGVKTLAIQLGLSMQEAKKLLAAIHEAAPFLKGTMDACVEEAEELGYITTILGRRSRFDLWVPKRYDPKIVPLPFDQAVLAYVNPQRADLHKALNRRLQGSAADLIKAAMLQCWEGGIFDETGVPRLTVHDELDFSDPGGQEKAFAEMVHVLETAIPFNVPIKVGNEVGPSWGEVEETPLHGLTGP